jgi:FemAB family.
VRVTTINPLEDSRWDDFVMGHPESTIFHHSDWARVLRDRYESSPTYYVIEGVHGEIVAAAPFVFIPSSLAGRRLVCLPCSEYGFPLVHSSEAIVQLIAAAKEEVKSGRVSFLEIRGWGSLGMPSEMGFMESPTYLRHVITLDEDIERLRAKLDHQNHHLKRNLRKAEESGLIVREARNENDVRQFHRLSVKTRRRLNLLPWPYHFIQSIYQHTVAHNLGFLLLAELHGKVIAGSLYLCFKDTVLLKINASDKDYSQYRGNYLITWKAIERACQRGYKRFDFGISDPDNLGLIAFKRQWGSEELPLPYYYYSATNHIKSIAKVSPTYRRLYATANNLMPDFTAKLAARALYRHLG